MVYCCVIGSTGGERVPRSISTNTSKVRGTGNTFVPGITTGSARPGDRCEGARSCPNRVIVVLYLLEKLFLSCCDRLVVVGPAFVYYCCTGGLSTISASCFFLCRCDNDMSPLNTDIYVVRELAG